MVASILQDRGVPNSFEATAGIRAFTPSYCISISYILKNSLAEHY